MSKYKPGGVLSDVDIRARIDELVTGIVDKSQIQPASIDLRMADRWFPLKAIGTIDANYPPNPSTYATARDGDILRINPFEMVLCSTIERVTVPPDLVAHVDGRSSLGRLGVQIHVTAGWIDPGFEGNITLEMVNLSPNAVLIRPGSRVCQIRFQTLTRTCEVQYADRGRYTGENAIGAVGSAGINE